MYTLRYNNLLIVIKN